MKKVAPKYNFIIGLDEVGRGSLAGPVTVAAVCLPRGYGSYPKKLGKPKDSKKITPKTREKWLEFVLSSPKIRYSLAHIESDKIDKLNISNAANLAAKKAFKDLCRKNKIDPKNSKIYLDGGLYIGKKGEIKEAVTMIKADEKVSAVSLASIVAKVSRDRLMCDLSEKYPGYGLNVNKGYGTRFHKKAILKWGASEIHRLTFLGESRIMRKNKH